MSQSYGYGDLGSIIAPLIGTTMVEVEMEFKLILYYLVDKFGDPIFFLDNLNSMNVMVESIWHFKT